MTRRHSPRIILSLAALLACNTLLFAAEDEATASFTAAQANAGMAGYAQHCASCHGNELEGFGLVPSLSGSFFAVAGVIRLPTNWRAM